MGETSKGYMSHLGGLNLEKIDDNNYKFNLEIKETHLNTGKIAHGGFLATIADTGMGTAAHQVAGNRRCVTINLNMQFITAAKLGENLIGKVLVIKKTNSLVFINCEIDNGKDVVASASGTWKIL